MARVARLAVEVGLASPLAIAGAAWELQARGGAAALRCLEAAPRPAVQLAAVLAWMESRDAPGSPEPPDADAAALAAALGIADPEGAAFLRDLVLRRPAAARRENEANWDALLALRAAHAGSLHDAVVSAACTALAGWRRLAPGCFPLAVALHFASGGRGWDDVAVAGARGLISARSGRLVFAEGWAEWRAGVVDFRGAPPPGVFPPPGEAYGDLVIIRPGPHAGPYVDKSTYEPACGFIPACGFMVAFARAPGGGRVLLRRLPSAEALWALAAERYLFLLGAAPFPRRRLAPRVPGDGLPRSAAGEVWVEEPDPIHGADFGGAVARGGDGSYDPDGDAWLAARVAPPSPRRRLATRVLGLAPGVDLVLPGGRAPANFDAEYLPPTILARLPPADEDTSTGGRAGADDSAVALAWAGFFERRGRAREALAGFYAGLARAARECA